MQSNIRQLWIVSRIHFKGGCALPLPRLCRTVSATFGGLSSGNKYCIGSSPERHEARGTMDVPEWLEGKIRVLDVLIIAKTHEIYDSTSLTATFINMICCKVSHYSHY